MDRQQAVHFVANMPVKDVGQYPDSSDILTDSFVISAISDEVTREWEEIE